MQTVGLSSGPRLHTATLPLPRDLPCSLRVPCMREAKCIIVLCIIVFRVFALAITSISRANGSFCFSVTRDFF